MGRLLPTECDHGVIVDGGDFCESEICEQCETECYARASEARERKVKVIADWLDAMSDGEAPMSIHERHAAALLDLIEEQEPPHA